MTEVSSRPDMFTLLPPLQNISFARAPPKTMRLPGESKSHAVARRCIALVVPVLLICIGAFLRPLNEQTGEVLILIGVVSLILQSLIIGCFCVILWMHEATEQDRVDPNWLIP